MKVLLVNGGPHRTGCTNRALEECATVLRQEGIEADILWLGNKPIAGCKACGYCAVANECTYDDMVNYVAEKLDEYDGFIFGTPVHYAAASGAITSFMDRLFYSAGAKLRGKPGAVITSARRGGTTATFDQLNKYLTINEMPVVSSCYWNNVHGRTAEDVEKDEEGLFIMRKLAANMAYLLKCIEAGKAAGIEKADVGERKFTNFIS